MLVRGWTTERHLHSVGTKSDGSLEDLWGETGSRLAQLMTLGLPVPPGFVVINTRSGTESLYDGTVSKSAVEDIRAQILRLENELGRTFGEGPSPLLLSVGPDAAVRLAGVMHHVLNVGLTTASVKALAAETGDPSFAYRSYLGLVASYAATVDRRTIHQLERNGKRIEADAEDLDSLCSDVLTSYHVSVGKSFPDGPLGLLLNAITAILRSLEHATAARHRRITKLGGVAAIVQAMVLGNIDEKSAVGVLNTRDPVTGERSRRGKVLFKAEREELISAASTPEPADAIRQRLPGVYKQLLAAGDSLERSCGDMQELEFTIQSRELFILRSRSGERSAKAALRIPIEMVNEGLISREQALLNINPTSLQHVLHQSFAPEARNEVLTSGLPASPGAAKGQVVLTPERAERWVVAGKSVLLVRADTTPEDISGMIASEGIVTVHSGLTSHAAVVARQMGKPCVVGCTQIEIDRQRGVFKVGSQIVYEGDVISIDGSTGDVMLGDIPTIAPRPSVEFNTVMEWADEHRALGVRANADTPESARQARKLGAEGIGVCRTEHMFFHKRRINTMRQLILARSIQERQQALDILMPKQRQDFLEIFRAMAGLPVTIRLLDPPLHEFLPIEPELQSVLAEKIQTTVEDIRIAVERLREANPMLGLRGIRLGILHPEIYEMQVRAILEAARQATQEGVTVQPEIMLPLVSEVQELRNLRRRITSIIEEVNAAGEPKIAALIGTMIEVPRAALTADKVAEAAEFFSFGTNDLTQMTLAVSRDDAEKNFLSRYVEDGIYSHDPFVSIDREGVGQLVRMACSLGRGARPDLKLGVCGEHGGDPPSIEFFHEVGLDYVSCAPYRVPIARLAAAQAAVRLARRRFDRDDATTK